ncbi:hypothetical protein FRC17_008740 [Serendipita sp. 399]|nr:hypothetical protein FRC17_008740 [Serendipita sp. 399]
MTHAQPPIISEIIDPKNESDSNWRFSAMPNLKEDFKQIQAEITTIATLRPDSHIARFEDFTLSRTEDSQ